MLVYSIQENPLMGKEALANSAAMAADEGIPTDIFLDSTSVPEDYHNGGAIGWLTTNEPNQDDYFVFSLIDDAGGRFAIDEFKQLVVANNALIDFETAQSHTIIVRVTAGGKTLDKLFVITVTDTASDGRATGPNLFGSEGADILTGTSGSDTIIGYFGNDLLISLAGDDSLSGYSGNDTLQGGDGSDWLAGHDGRDLLKGGKGKDGFAFNMKPGRKDSDRIVDFSVKDDTVFLDNLHMSKLGSRDGSRAVKLKKAFFVKGAKAKDKNDYVIYNDKKGMLYYDADGSGKGKQLEIASISKNLKMTSADFLIL